jgi:hypothetical protein
MKIDDEVEKKVRDTLHWAVKQKPDELNAALQGFADESVRLAALELLAQISMYAATDAFNGKPTLDQIRALAVEVAEAEAWASLSADQVSAFLAAVIHGQPGGMHLTADEYVALSFVVAASLLSSQPKPEGQWWFDYLDKVEAAIESAP